MNSTRRKLTQLVLILFISVRAHAFPEMVRHGYVSCTACHLSTNGGGILTPYGRSLSREVLSHAGAEGEERFLYGAVSPPDWLSFGGDIRAVQTYTNTSRVEAARFIFMQAELETAISLKQWNLVVSGGRQQPTRSDQSAFSSRRHYLMYRPTDQISFRIGKFQVPYGINTADHAISIKKGLSWDIETESYNLEASWLGENFELFLAGSAGRPDAIDLNIEKGLAIRSAASIAETFKVGFGYFYGARSGNRRHLFGPYAMLGITPRFFVLAEIDFQNSLPDSAATKWGLVSYLRVNYEFMKGFHGYFTQEITQTDFNDSLRAVRSYGIGAQVFPRPHIELNGMFLKQRIGDSSRSFDDFAWLMLHYYL